MKVGFFCMATKGTTPPKYIHLSYDLALAEAKKLSEKFNDTVLVLEVKAVVKQEEVPVTKTITTVKEIKDDLPF